MSAPEPRSCATRSTNRLSRLWGFLLKRILLILGTILLVAVLGVAAAYFALGAPPYGSNQVVPGRTMEPTLKAGERVIANPRVEPTQGSIVLYTEPGADEMLAGRVIATGGQTVDLVGGRVTVDGKLLDEPYRQGQPTYPTSPAVTFPVEVRAGELWILGDKRSTMADSRQFGPVSAASVKGVVTVVYWPLTGFRILGRSR
jgi:signal peptidase I